MRIKNLFTLLIVLLTINSSVAGTVERLMEEGDRLRSDFQNTEAARKYEQAYKIDNESFEIMKKLVLSYNDAGEDYRDTAGKKAEKFFEKAIQYAEISKENFPDHEDNYFLLALTYGNLARFSDGKKKVELARNVKENITKMIEQKPDFAPSYVVLGVYYREVAELNWLVKKFADSLLGGLPEGSLQDSRKVLEKAVTMRPDAIYAHFELAQTCEELHHYKDAAFHYNKVIELPVSDHLDDLKKKKSHKALERIAEKNTPEKQNAISLTR